MIQTIIFNSFVSHKMSDLRNTSLKKWIYFLLTNYFKRAFSKTYFRNHSFFTKQPEPYIFILYVPSHSTYEMFDILRLYIGVMLQFIHVLVICQIPHIIPNLTNITCRLIMKLCSLYYKWTCDLPWPINSSLWVGLLSKIHNFLIINSGRWLQISWAKSTKTRE